MDPVEIGKLIVPLAALAGIYLKLQSAVRQMAGKGEGREITNNPLHVQELARPATIHDVERVEKRVYFIERDIKEMKRDTDDFREKLRGDITGMRDDISDKVQTQNEALRELTRAVGRLEGH